MNGQIRHGRWGIPNQGNSQKGVNCYTTAEYKADPVTLYEG